MMKTTTLKEQCVPPFKYDNAGTMVFDSKNNLVLDIRGFGRLQYFSNGCEVQDELGELVVELLNKHFANEPVTD